MTDKQKFLKEAVILCDSREQQNRHILEIVESRIASYNTEQSAEIVLNAIMSAIEDNVQVLDIDSL